MKDLTAFLLLLFVVIELFLFSLFSMLADEALLVFRASSLPLRGPGGLCAASSADIPFEL